MMNRFDGVEFNEMYELIPDDSRKSFYGKAKVLINTKTETEYLLSYSTIVAAKKGGKVYRIWDGWSATTGRHIKAFCGMGKAQFDKESIRKAV